MSRKGAFCFIAALVVYLFAWMLAGADLWRTLVLRVLEPAGMILFIFATYYSARTLMKEYREVNEKLTALSEKEGGGDNGEENNVQGDDSLASERAKLEARRDEIVKEMSPVRPKRLYHGWVWLFERRK